MQPLETGSCDRTIGRHLLPAIGGRRGDVGRADIVPNEGAGLEQI
jgi:hypothetical protein